MVTGTMSNSSPEQVHAFRFETAAGSLVGARHYAAPGRERAGVVVVLAHGAGAGHDHPFMVGTASALARRGLDVVTFNFPYKEAGRRVPDRAATLEGCYLAVIAAVRSRLGAPPAPLVIGGKSLGGRMASHVAAHHAEAAGPLAGLVFLGYPLHPPDRPAQLRAAHLPLVRPPMLFVQGERDPFGTPAELAPVVAALGPRAELLAVPGGDHSLGVPARGRLLEPRLAAFLDPVAAWVRAVGGPLGG